MMIQPIDLEFAVAVGMLSTLLAEIITCRFFRGRRSSLRWLMFMTFCSSLASYAIFALRY